MQKSSPKNSSGSSSGKDLKPSNLEKVSDVEFGLQSTNEGEDSKKEISFSIERGIGISSGWSANIANIRQWWRHRGCYREWRRDVRWAMFNKRAKGAIEMFTDLFGEDFDDLIPIYPTKAVDKLIGQWDNACAQLERAQHDLLSLTVQESEVQRKNMEATAEGREKPGSQSPTTTRCFGLFPGKDAARRNKIDVLKKKIHTLSEKTTELQEKITIKRDEVLSDIPSTCFFATFKSQEAAAIAAQANLNPVQQRLFNVQAAPSPDDINWPTLTRSWWQRQSRPVFALPLILFIMLLPIGAFTGAFAQLTIAICGTPADSEAAWSPDSWYCSDDRWAEFSRNLMTSLAPTLFLSMYHMIILPVLVYYAAQAEGQHYSLSALDLRCASLFYYWYDSTVHRRFLCVLIY